MYHPQTDGASERSNKTIVQCLHFHVKRNQRGWAKVLPKVRFDMMNSINASTSISPFILKTGRSPRLIPLLTSTPSDDTLELEPIDAAHAHEFMENMEEETNAARDNLLTAKLQQAHFVNKDRRPDSTYTVGKKVFLATAHRQ